MTKQNRILNSYWFFIGTSLLVALFSWAVFLEFGKTTAFLLFLLYVTLNAWYEGRKTGLLALFVSVAVIGVITFTISRLPSSNFIIFFYETGPFVVTGTIISVVIGKYKKTDIVGVYKQKEREYIKLLTKLEEENSKMKKEITLRDEFLSIASHELKTPLTSMLLKLQSILHNIRNVSLANFSVENLLKMLETAEQQTQRLSRMINDLLNVSLITTGKFNLEFGETDLSETVKSVVGEFSERLKDNHYTLRLEADGPLPAQFDKLRIEQALTNLLSNAIKYGNGRPIEVSVSKNRSFAKIVIKDHGIGIEQSQSKKIFELFERGVSNNSYKGLGVGLYIVGQIIKAHHGTIILESKPDKGSTFTIELPLKNST